MRTYVILFLFGLFLSSCASTGSCINKDGVNECQQRRLENMGNRGGRY